MVTQAAGEITKIPGQYLDVGGLRTHYLQAGSGHPLLILHGGAPGASARVLYGGCIEALAARGFAVYAPDAPGFGLTGFPSDPSVEYRIEHAMTFATAMGLDRYHVLGNSAGGYPALRLALDDPRVTKAVIIATGGVDVPVSPETQAVLDEHRKYLAAYTPGLANMRQLTLGTLHRPELVTDELVKLRYEMSVGPNYEARLRQPPGAAPARPSRAIAAELRTRYSTKTLVLWGKNDHGNPIESGYRIAELIPSAELHTFANCGHWPMWDQRERFVAVVADFLNAPA